jgi:hypothetical protein
MEEFLQLASSPASLSQQRISAMAREMFTWDRQDIVDKANAASDPEEFAACVAVVRYLDAQSVEETDDKEAPVFAS